MGNDSRLEVLLRDTPWDRIVHWYGRATEFPDQARLVASGQADAAVFDQISNSIEHQDGVMQASPFMVAVLLECLREPNSDKPRILAVLQQVYNAVVSCGRAPFDNPELPLADELWPPFVDADTDAGLWEEFQGENFPYWQQHCCDEIKAARTLIGSFGDEAFIWS
ncbi:MAG: hypothetical protein LBR19_01080 [Bifidobacteriaceae bacterium]|jgi:hypothetical protein|nr:hypothetical protein [Bifidobacteriaceae bacterium]